MGGGTAGGLWRHQQWLHLGHHLGFYQELEIRLKPRENVLCFKWKITHKWAVCMILSTRFTSIVERSWKNMSFHPKMAWPPATYDIISQNHSNLLSLNLSQKCARDERTATENVRCWCFILQEKTQKTLCPLPPPPLVQHHFWRENLRAVIILQGV